MSDEPTDNVSGHDREMRDQVREEIGPPGMELGRPPEKPMFDPHAGREIAPGREHDELEPMISTLVFMGVDRGGDFEDTIQMLVTQAETLGLRYVTASIAPLDIEEHLGKLEEIAEIVSPEPEID